MIPVYNEEKLIQETLLKLQPLRALGVEVIVSDDGSTDNSVQLARPLADNVIVRTEPHTTIGACRNRGAKAAQGDILWFIDADVRLPKAEQAYEWLTHLFEEQSQLVGVTLASRIYLAEESLADHIWLGWWRNITLAVQNNILHIGGASGECQIIRRTAFEQVKGYHPLLIASEDYALFKELGKIGRVKFVWKYWIETSPRRFRHDGWMKVLWQWFGNWCSYFVFGRISEKPWEARR